jgi:uncharacterized protein YggE
MRLSMLAIAVLAVSLIAFPARSQVMADGVSGSGVGTVKRAPDVLRMQVQLSAEGKTLKDALTKLTAKREACKKKLAALGAKDESIVFEDPKMDTPDPRQMAQAMMLARQRGRGRPTTSPAGAGAAAPARVAIAVKAEWPLAAGTPEELLANGQELLNKIKAADVADTKTASLEEQERMEEMAGNNDPSEQTAPPGQPVFFFVAKLSEEQRAQALAEACKKAKTSAAELAKAAGVELGAIKQLQAQTLPDAEQYQMMQYGRYNPYMYQQQAANTEAGEALAMQPGMMTVRMTVVVTFAIK